MLPGVAKAPAHSLTTYNPASPSQSQPIGRKGPAGAGPKHHALPPVSSLAEQRTKVHVHSYHVWLVLSMTVERRCVTRASRWPDPDSNRGHHDFQSCALPTELSGREIRCYRLTRGSRRVPHAIPRLPSSHTTAPLKPWLGPVRLCRARIPPRARRRSRADPARSTPARASPARSLCGSCPDSCASARPGAARQALARCPSRQRP